jgi:hypothetical protein
VKGLKDQSLEWANQPPSSPPNPDPHPAYLSTGSLLLDASLGGGLVPGRVTTVFGSRERLLFLMWVLKRSLEEKRKTLYVALEGPFDKDLAQSMHVPEGPLWVLQGVSLEIAQQLLRERVLSTFDVLLIDALDALDHQQGNLRASGRDQFEARQAVSDLLTTEGRLPQTVVLIGRQTREMGPSSGLKIPSHYHLSALFLEPAPRVKRVRVHVMSRRSTLPRETLDIPLRDDLTIEERTDLHEALCGLPDPAYQKLVKATRDRQQLHVLRQLVWRGIVSR